MTLPKPKVYINTIKDSPNQNFYHVNYLKELLDLQQNKADQFRDSLMEMSNVIQQNNKKQSDSFFHIINRLENNDLITKEFLLHFQELKKKNDLFMNQIKVLEKDRENVKETLQKECSLNQEIVERLKVQEEVIDHIKTKLGKEFLNYDHLSERINSFENTQKDIAAKFIILDSYHESVFERLENQEAITHKLSRQIEALRSTLFERVSHITEIINKEFNKLKNPAQRLLIKNEDKDMK